MLSTLLLLASYYLSSYDTLQPVCAGLGVLGLGWFLSLFYFGKFHTAFVEDGVPTE